MPHSTPTTAVALTVAGFDPSSGAGVTADLKTFAAHGVYGTACITALTVQSTQGVFGVQPISKDLFRVTLERLEEDLPPAGIKVGMLGDEDIVSTLCDYLESVRAQRPVVVVLDPVFRSSSGADMLTPAAQRLLRERLLPLTTTVTPNRHELACLVGRPNLTQADLLSGARELQQAVGGREVVVTGGDAEEPTDLVLLPDGTSTDLPGTHIESASTHGTGCAFSTALLCRHLEGDDLLSAARAAKQFVEQAIRTAPGIGAGRGPLHHLWPLLPKISL